MATKLHDGGATLHSDGWQIDPTAGDLKLGPDTRACLRLCVLCRHIRINIYVLTNRIPPHICQTIKIDSEIYIRIWWIVVGIWFWHIKIWTPTAGYLYSLWLEKYLIYFYFLFVAFNLSLGITQSLLSIQYLANFIILPSNFLLILWIYYVNSPFFEILNESRDISLTIK